MPLEIKVSRAYEGLKTALSRKTAVPTLRSHRSENVKSDGMQYVMQTF
jgi:hypothetical protein